MSNEIKSGINYGEWLFRAISGIATILLLQKMYQLDDINQTLTELLKNQSAQTELNKSMQREIERLNNRVDKLESRTYIVQ